MGTRFAVVGKRHKEIPNWKQNILNGVEILMQKSMIYFRTLRKIMVL